MAVPRNIPVQFGDIFPSGAFAVGEVYATKDFEKSTRDNEVQALDKDSGKRLWSIDVVDGDPEAKKSTRSLTVKIAANVQPVLPDNPSSSPFRPVEFDKLTIGAYVETNGDFSKVSWTFRAAEVRAPGKGSGGQQRPSAA
jgi:hypothetical protein